MLPFHDLTKDLPPLRDDEPPSLRQEIIDEVADHLLCSLRRELLLNSGDEASARRNVLEKFGDPSQIVRRLWFQAMWSKIMSHRVVLVLASTSIMVSLVLAATIVWLVQQHSTEMAAMQARMAETTSSIKDLVVQMQKPTAPESKRDPNWNHLQIKVTLDSNDGPPAVGYRVRVLKVPRIGEAKKDLQTHVATLGNNGIEDCSYVEAGVYEVEIGTPWGESAKSSFVLKPGQDHVEHVLAPAKMPEISNVAITFMGIPDDLKNSEVGVVYSIHVSGSTSAVGKQWTMSNSGGFQTTVQFPNRELYWVDKGGAINEPNDGRPWLARRIIKPKIMYIAGHGYWTPTSTFNEYALHNPGSSMFQQITWEQCNFPLELQMPAHEYKVEYIFFRLNRDVDPTGPKWKEAVSGDPTSLPPDRSKWGTELSESFYAVPNVRNEWKIEVPATIVDRLKVWVWGPRWQPPGDENGKEAKSDGNAESSK